jgi:hypothetical protein
MILEAFAETLKAQFLQRGSAIHVLQQWLLWHLKHPTPTTEDKVRDVLLAEIELTLETPVLLFQGKSPSGDILLKSLYEYCLSYEDWQYRRWLHEVKASDFSEGFN